MERLSTGKRINSASDDAAGLAIETRMTSQVRGLQQASRNANDGISMLQTADGAASEMNNMLQRMRELAVQAVNDTNTDTDRKYLQGEVTALLAEINRVADQTQYNGEAILDGTRAGNIQVGTEATQTVAFDIASIKTTNLGKYGDSGSSSLDSISVLDSTKATDALAKITDSIEQVAGDRAGYGALQNRLEYTVSNLMNVSEFTTAARSRISDADFAAESARLAKAQVLQQSGTAMLAQANASSQLALSLIR